MTASPRREPMAQTRRQPVPAPVPLVGLPCPREACRRVLGQTDGERLFLVSCVIAQRVTLYCTQPGCGGRRTWYPPAERNERRHDS